MLGNLQAPSHLRAFALAVPSYWMVLPQAMHTYFRPPVWYYLMREKGLPWPPSLNWYPVITCCLHTPFSFSSQYLSLLDRVYTYSISLCSFSTYRMKYLRRQTFLWLLPYPQYLEVLGRWYAFNRCLLNEGMKESLSLIFWLFSFQREGRGRSDSSKKCFNNDTNTQWFGFFS